MRINHNISSLRALNQMHKSNLTLDKTLERLSSGLRINHAADDAAGLAISQKMDTQVRGLGQANRNAMDGISLIQTAEGALNEVHSMLQRIRELSVQVSNGTYDSSDRKAVQSEVNELLSEIERISTDTEFNEKKLLNGNLDNRVFSTDTNIAKHVSISAGVKPGRYTFEVTTAATKTSVEGAASAMDMFDTDGKASVGGLISINNESVDISKGDSADDVLSKIRDLADKANLNMTVQKPYGNGKKITLENKYTGAKEISIEGESNLLEKLGLGTSKTVTEGKDCEINGTSLAGDFPPEVTADEASGNYVTFKGNNGFEFKIEGMTGAGMVSFDVLKTGPLNLQIGANEGQFMKVKLPELSPRTLGIREANLTNQDTAQKAITLADTAINIVSDVRSRLGAYQNRLEYTTANLSSAAENLTASMSRIQDADMAYEMSQFTQKNIISQAGNSMLAQANQRPQALLQLLQRG